MLNQDVPELLQEKQFTLLVRPSQYSLLDGSESVRCEREYAVLALRLLARLCGASSN